MPEPRLLLGRYELHDLIGAGGSARVYDGHDNVLDRRVAVKLLDATAADSADPAGSKRFVREARSSARFAHPRAVSIYDAGNDGGDLFLVMEYVDGTSLSHVIADRAPMTEPEMVRIAVDVLEALGAAHAAGLMHRDVKPANVLIERDGRAKLADFGIAQRFDEISTSLTAEGMVIGTRGYMSPERSRGEDAGPAADLFAVGAIMYEMATGQRPPVPEPTSELGPNLDLVRDGLSLEFVSAVATALAAHPDDRFGTASEMVTAIDGRLPATQLALADRPLDPDDQPAVSAPPTATAAIPHDASARAVETNLMPGSSGAAAGSTVLMSGPAALPPPQRHRSPWSVLAAVVGLVVLAIAIVIGTRNTGDDVVTSSVDTSLDSEVVPETSTAAIPLDVPGTTAPATRVATDPAPPTTLPATAPTEAAAIAELIPGFPATDDLDQFVDQLKSTKVAGKQSKRLGDALRDVARSDKNRDKEIADLRDQIDGWLDKDQIDPVIAARSNEFLDTL